MDNQDYFDGYDQLKYMSRSRSMSKPRVWLDNWSIVPSLDVNSYMAPEHLSRQPVLYGRVSGHPRYKDGTYIATSCILMSSGREVETNNTVYKLGLMAGRYREWCYFNGIDIDPKQPVKVDTVYRVVQKVRSESID